MINLLVLLAMLPTLSRARDLLSHENTNAHIRPALRAHSAVEATVTVTCGNTILGSEFLFARSLIVRSASIEKISCLIIRAISTVRGKFLELSLRKIGNQGLLFVSVVDFFSLCVFYFVWISGSGVLGWTNSKSICFRNLGRTLIVSGLSFLRVHLFGHIWLD